MVSTLSAVPPVARAEPDWPATASAPPVFPAMTVLFTVIWLRNTDKPAPPGDPVLVTAALPTIVLFWMVPPLLSGAIAIPPPSTVLPVAVFPLIVTFVRVAGASPCAMPPPAAVPAVAVTVFCKIDESTIISALRPPHTPPP